MDVGLVQAERPNGGLRPLRPWRLLRRRARRQPGALRRGRPVPHPAQRQRREPSGSSATAHTTVDEMVRALTRAPSRAGDGDHGGRAPDRRQARRAGAGGRRRRRRRRRPDADADADGGGDRRGRALSTAPSENQTCAARASPVRSVASRTVTATVGVMPVDIRDAKADDYDELFVAFSRIVARGRGLPADAPGHARRTSTTIGSSTPRPSSVARFGGYLIGAYYIKPNFVGRASHIANAGYFVSRPYRGTGVGRAAGRALAARGAAARVRRHACSTLSSSPTRPGPCTVKLGFEEVGRIPRAVEGEDAADLLAQPRGRRASMSEASTVKHDDVTVRAARRARRRGHPAPPAEQLLRHRAH